MTIDFDQLARAARCDSGHLRSAVTLLRQGYRPSFLARYRRDELGGILESSLWVADLAVRTEERIAKRKADLERRVKTTELSRPSVDSILRDAATEYELDLAARLLKSHALDSTDAHRLALRLIRPMAGDDSDPVKLVEDSIGSNDPVRTEAALAGWVDALPDLLTYDLRILRSASQWLSRNARVQIGEIREPSHDEEVHGEAEDDAHADEHDAIAEAAADESVLHADESGSEELLIDSGDQSAALGSLPNGESDAPVQTVATSEPSVIESAAEEAPVAPEVQASEQVAAEPVAAEELVSANETPASGKSPRAGAGKKEKPKQEKQAREKRMSPRQRRRRWLVGVLKPLAGKTIPPHRLTGFQKLMLLRGERSSIAHPRLVYDRLPLVRHLQKVASGFNPAVSKVLRDKIEEIADPLLGIAEQFFWDEQLHEVKNRLVVVTADRFRRENLRPALQAKRVLAIDAVGPKTVAVAVVTRAGRVVYTEDIPCQLSGPFRQQMVTRLGELIHKYRTDLLVVSNGPARRAALAALRDLFTQSQPDSLHWTIVDRAGADIFASSPAGDRQMRHLPRRFRAAAWLALHLLNPLDAVAEIDPTRLRLCSYQRELPKSELKDALLDLLGAALAGRGVDVNVDPISMLTRMPGVTPTVAEAIDARRRSEPLKSRAELMEVEGWTEVDKRQAIAFLRIYGGEKSLDTTSVHPDDYRLAEKLLTSLEIPEPPAMPPGYILPEAPRKGAKSDTPAVSVAESQEGTEAPAVEPQTESESAPVAADTTREAAAVTEGQSEEAANAETLTEPTENSASPSDEQQETPEVSIAALETLPSELEGFANAKAPAVEQTPVIEDSEPEFVCHPLPPEEKILKVIKEWQVGPNRVRQIIHWLTDPRGSGVLGGKPAIVMGTVPQLSELHSGQAVAGVVVGVTPFGAFVELAPDCNGLIHVSRLTEDYLEDPHEAVQVGDVVNAYVLEVDHKRRRVALSCISPERLQQIEQAQRDSHQRNEQDSRQPRGREGQQRESSGNRGGGRGSNEGRRDAGLGQGQGRSSGSGQGQRQTAGQGHGHGQGNRGGQAPARGAPRQSDARGNKPRGKGDRRDRQHDDRSTGSRTVARVERPQATTPITDEMKTGAEPLRSFGDLMQFYQTKTAPAVAQTPAEPQVLKPATSDTEVAADESPAAQNQES